MRRSDCFDCLVSDFLSCSEFNVFDSDVKPKRLQPQEIEHGKLSEDLPGQLPEQLGRGGVVQRTFFTQFKIQTMIQKIS